MSFYEDGPSFEIQGHPTASPEAQVRYLLKVVALQGAQIATLKRELETVRLGTAFEEYKLREAVEGLGRVAKHIQKSPLDPRPKRRRWWRFW